ncbi:hypothetical protein EVAR_84978_1 [Eumeta japonica]|uniref:Uncharacterized protein n=1 Tax=Eumeta variegata TaxID=151549 RepID=A0A4C1VHA6_EUMVA|nr:hypothetical protein EVAR_84978_1 [Eumeta japonica]
MREHKSSVPHLHPQEKGHPLPEPAVTVEDDVGEVIDTFSGSPAESRNSGVEEHEDDTTSGVPTTAVKRPRYTLSSPSPTLKSAPKKMDKRSLPQH